MPEVLTEGYFACMALALSLLNQFWYDLGSANQARQF